MPSAPAQFLALTGEALGDAVRRRVAAALAILALLSLAAVDSCTACAAGTFTVNGIPVDGSRIFGWTGIALYALLALWTVAISGALASDHLQQSLDDGTAQLALARPVGRGVFALARLTGALAVSLGTGGVLLAGTALFLHARYGFGLGPAAAAAAGAALGAIVVSSLAMTASLFLPRLATLAAVFLAVASVGAGVGMAMLRTPSEPEVPVAVAAAVHLLGAVPNASMAEMVFPSHPLMAELVVEPLVVDRTGHVELSERPGLAWDWSWSA